MNKSINRLLFLILIASVIILLSSSWDASVIASLISKEKPLQADTSVNPSLNTGKTALPEFATANKTLSANESIVPDFIWDAILEFNPNASSAEIAKIRAMTITQFTFNQKRITDTNGAILNPNSPHNYHEGATDRLSIADNIQEPGYTSMSQSFAYMSEYLRPEIDGPGASLTDPTYLVGLMDGQGARLYTPNPGSHVAIVGAMSFSTIGADVYLTAKLGPTAAGHIGNYVVVWGCWYDDQTNPPPIIWVPIGFSKITTSDYGWYYIASASTFDLNDIEVNVISRMNPTGGPPGGIDPYNDIYVDSIAAYPQESPDPPVYKSLTIDASSNGTTSPSAGTYSYIEGSHVCVSSVPNWGYALDNWTVDSTSTVYDIILAITMNTDHTVVPHFDVGHYLDVQYSEGGYAFIGGGWPWFIEGRQATVTAVPDQGFMLANWTVDNSYVINNDYVGSANSFTLTMDGNHTVYATFIPAATVTFYPWYGSDPYVPGFVPANLYIDGGFYGANGTFTLPLGNHTFRSDLLSYYDSGSESYYYFSSFLQVTGQYYPYTLTPFAANPVTLDIQVDSLFIIWYYGPYIYPPNYLSVASSQGGYAYASGIAFAPDENVPVYAVPNEGYELAYWTVDGVYAGADNPLTVTMDADHNVTANFSVFHYLNLQSELGGTAYSPGGPRYVNGAQATLNVADVLPGYSFANWTVDGNPAGSSLPLNITMDSDHTVVAYFTETTSHHYLTLQSTAGGSAWASGSYFVEDTVVPVYAYADANAEFTGWTIDGIPVGDDNPYYVTMDADHVAVAHFQQYATVSFESRAGSDFYVAQTVAVDLYMDGQYLGATNGDPFVIPYGNHTFSLYPAIEDSGYYYWFTNFFTVEGQFYPYTFVNQGDTIPSIIDVEGDMNLYMWFYGPSSAAPMTLTVECDGSGSVTCASNYASYDFGYVIPQDTGDYFTATASVGYQFSHWELDSAYAGTSDTIYVSMDTPHTLTAYFTQT
jgi:hypothetical protein